MKAVILALMAIGCGDNDQRVEGDHYQYVVDELRVPSNNLTARESALDLDGDGIVENQLGQIFSLLHQFELGVGDTAREAVLRGGLVMLAELVTMDFEDSKLSGFTTYLGGDPVPAPCLDPARLETCGQHLLGQGTFSVEDGSASDRAVGKIVDGVFENAVGALPVELVIDPTMPIRLDLHAARVRLTQMSEGHISAIIGGGITKADVEGVVIPQAVAQMVRIVDAECAQPDGAAPCGCVRGSRAQLIQDSFDSDDNCTISIAELSSNSIVRGLIASDIRVDGENLLSFGIGVELTSATFESAQADPAQ